MKEDGYTSRDKRNLLNDKRQNNGIIEPRPVCPRCKSSSQVWVNQLTGKMTCHRAGCQVQIDKAKNGI